MSKTHSLAKYLCFTTITLSVSPLFSESSTKESVTQFFNHQDFVQNFIETSSGSPEMKFINFDKIAYTAFRAYLAEDFETTKKCVHLLTKHNKISLLNNRYPVDNEQRITLLMAASANGDVAIARFLIQQSVSIDVINDSNETALLLAIKNHRLEVVKLLIQHAKITKLELENLLDVATEEKEWLEDEVKAIKKALNETDAIIAILKNKTT